MPDSNLAGPKTSSARRRTKSFPQLQIKMHKKVKGEIAELAVAAELLTRGWSVLFPFGEHHRYDVAAEKDGKFVRVQVKYVTPSEGKLDVNCKSSNNWSVDRYTAQQVDIIAAYDPETKKIYFIPSAKFNSSSIKLRLKPAGNNQRLRTHQAKDFLFF